MEEKELLIQANKLMSIFGEDCPLILFDKINMKETWCKENCNESTPIECWKMCIEKGLVKNIKEKY